MGENEQADQKKINNSYVFQPSNKMWLQKKPAHTKQYNF